MRKLTHEQFLEKLSNVNPNIEVLGAYVKMTVKIKCRCKIDGYIWDVIPNSLMRGLGCPKCAGNNRKTHEEFVAQMHEINPNIEVLSKYISDQKRVKCRCLIDGHEWEPRANSLVRGKGCPKCSHHIRITTEMFIAQMAEINPDIEILGEYVHCEKNIKCKCKIDGHIWEAMPNNLKRGTGCPICNASKGEKRISRYLSKHGISFEPQKIYDELIGIGGKNLLYDFYLPDYNLLIEYQGNFHDGTVTGSYQRNFDFERQIEHDRRKKKYAKDNGIRFLEIWYNDYNNLETILGEIRGIT